MSKRTPSSVALPTPSKRFHSPVPIESAVFDSPERTKETALKVFEAWVRQLPLGLEKPSDLVRSVETSVRYIGRLSSTIVERKVVSKEGPYGGDTPANGSWLEAHSVDPWAYSLETLRRASLKVGMCPSCTGTGGIACPTCRGSQAVTCSGCNGAGKAYGYASNGSRRLMNCKQCSRKGTVACTTCTQGTVTCQPCRGRKRFEYWLEFVETRRDVVRVALDNEETRAFQWSAAGPKANPAEIEADARLLGELNAPGAIAEADAAEFAPRAWLQENWKVLQPELGPGERVQNQALQLFGLPRVLVSYSLAGAPPSLIGLEGRRMLAPPVSADEQFRARTQKLRLARHALLAVGFGIPLFYLLRGSYFWNAWVGALALCVAGAALATMRFIRESVLGGERARRWVVPAAVAAVLACLLAVKAEPTLSAAERLLSAGQLEAARVELTALGEPTRPERAQAWAALHLAHALGSREVGVIAHDVALIPEGAPQRATAEQHLYDVTHQSVSQHLANKELGAARAALAQAIPVLHGNDRSAPFSGRLAELSALEGDAEFKACPTDACRWKAAFESSRAVPSTEREERLSAVRARIVDELKPQQHPGESTLSRLQRLDVTVALAKTINETPGDEDLRAKARAAVVWSHDERQKIPLVGAERAVATELLRISNDDGRTTLSTELASVAVHCGMKGGRCTGVYLVGSAKGARVLNDSAHAAITAELMSQALGHPAVLPSPPSPVGGKALTASKWRDGGVTIVARWQGMNLMELRLGDAQP